MNRDLVTKLAYEYLDQPLNPNWSGLYHCLREYGCTPCEAQEILMAARNGEY